MAQPDRLRAESAAWEREGLITAAQRDAILARYEKPDASSQQAALLLTWLAVIVAAVGAVVLVAWNWLGIPASAKIVLSAGPMVALYVGAAMFARADRPVIAERLALVAALFAGGALLVTDDLLHVNSARTATLLIWTAVIAATAALTPSPLIAGLAALVGTWALLLGAGGMPPWWMLAVWGALALAVEGRPNRWVASAVTLAFGIWIFFLALGQWNDQPTVPAIAAVLAANWLYTLALLPPPRRPAFARVTPALVVTMLALALLLPSGSHRAMIDWRVSTTPPWPAFALLAALAGSTFWNIHRAGAWRSRPAGLTILAVLWLVAWLALPASVRANTSLRWTWTAIFSGAMVHLGAASVRDAVRSRDLGQLVVGLASVVIFMLVRALDARSLVVSGLMLIASGLLLWWLARLWGRPAAGAVRR